MFSELFFREPLSKCVAEATTDESVDPAHSLRAPWFQKDSLSIQSSCTLTDVTLDLVGLSHAVGLIDICPLLRSVTFRSMYRDFKLPPPSLPPTYLWVRIRSQMRNLTIFASDCHYMELLQYFDFTRLEHLTIAKYNPGDVTYKKNDDKEFCEFLKRWDPSDLRTICIGDCGGDTEPLESLIDVLSLAVDMPGSGPRYFPLLETFVVPKLTLFHAELRPFLQSLSAFAIGRAWRGHPVGLQSMMVSVECRGLEECPGAHPRSKSATRPDDYRVDPCDRCAEKSVRLKEMHECVRLGVVKVELTINKKVVFAYPTAL